MAQTYIEKIKKVQLHGPYYILGWSLGGTIAFEVVRQLEQMNEDVRFLALIDSAPPHNEDFKNPGEFQFTLQSESNYIKDYLPDSGIKETLENLTGLDRFWFSVLEYLKANNYDVETVRTAIRQYGMHALPNYNRLDIRESIYYLNVGRTFHHASESYIPQGKIHTPIHYFAASESKEIIDRELWNRYTEIPVKAFEITGDHLSIFKMPGVETFAKLFDNVLENVYNRD
jgi:thioesterase domain-containing protein